MNENSCFRVFRHCLTPGRPLGGTVMLLAVAVAPLHAAPARYEIDPEHLSIGFLVDHVGYKRVLGMFRKAGGSFAFDEETGELSDIRVSIETESVFTNHRKRDDHLKGADFLNSAEYPQMVFTAAGAQRTGDRTFVINGELELLGQKRPVKLEARWNKSAEYPFGGSLLGGKPYVMGVSASGSFKRSDWGMNYGVDKGWVGDDVELIIELEAVRQ